MKKIVIGREAYDKIMHYVHKAKFEISGFGNVQIIKGVPTVTDIILIKQENSPAETEMDGDAIAKAMYDHHISGMEGELKFWWHSHVNMSVFWSATDMATINSLTEQGWWTHGVFNKKNEYKCAYSNNDPFPVFLDDLDMEIDEDLISDDELYNAYIELDAAKDKIKKQIGKDCDEKFEELVTDRTYVPYQYGQYTGKYKGGVKTTSVGKQLAALNTGSNSMENFPSASTIPFGGAVDPFDLIEGIDAEGALELFRIGYTVAEINYMQGYMLIWDAQCLAEYESRVGIGAVMKELMLEVHNTTEKTGTGCII